MSANLKAHASNKEASGKEGQGSAVAQELFKVVCDSYVLLTKTQGYHWNVTGPQFYSLHKLFEEQYNELFAAIDPLAERVRALNAFAPISASEMVKNSGISESAKVPAAEEMVRELLRSHEYMSKAIRNAIKLSDEAGDDATVDLLTTRLEAHDQAAWMLRSTL